MTNELIQITNDPWISLEDLQIKISSLIEQYGGDALLYCDGGYNNVIIMLDRRIDSLKEYQLQKDKGLL